MSRRFDSVRRYNTVTEVPDGTMAIKIDIKVCLDNGEHIRKGAVVECVDHIDGLGYVLRNEQLVPEEYCHNVVATYLKHKVQIAKELEIPESIYKRLYLCNTKNEIDHTWSVIIHNLI